MSVDAFAVALSTVFDAAGADGFETTIALVVDGDALVVEIHDGALEVHRGSAEHADARIEGSVAVLREVLWRGRSRNEAEGKEAVTVSGSRIVARRFLKLFPSPAQHPPALGR